MQHTFSTSVNLSSLGAYDITVSVTQTGDENAGNDTFTKTVYSIDVIDNFSLC